MKLTPAQIDDRYFAYRHLADTLPTRRPTYLQALDDQTFGLVLLDWHGGQSSGVYSVGSMLLAGHVMPTDSRLRAIRELRRTREDANFPEAVSDADVAECNALADEIQRRAAR